MKLTISFVFLILSASVIYSDQLLEGLLRNAAIANGYLPPSKLDQSFDEEKSRIGKKIFEASLMSFNSDTSCKSCHLKEFSSADGLPNAVGVGGSGEGHERLMSDGLIVPRNTLPLWGRGAIGFSTFFWDGKVQRGDGQLISQFGDMAPSDDPLITAVHLPFVEIREMVVDDQTVDENYKDETVSSARKIMDRLIAKLAKDELGQELAISVKKNKDELAFIDVATVVAHHIKNQFALGESKFSRFMEGKDTFSKKQLQGGLIFYGKGNCASCHSGAHFSDFKFHTIINPQMGFGKNGFGIDYGRFNVTRDYQDLYKFRTPPLANVIETAPYGHSGSVRTIEEIIVSHFDPLRYFDMQKLDVVRRRELFERIQTTVDQPNVAYLDNKEINDLIEFLKTLTF